MSQQGELRERVTNKIVAALRSGNVPFWRRPWSQQDVPMNPSNAVSRKPYQGVNVLLTTLAALEKGYESKWWATVPQWNALCGRVRRGEKGTQIILYKPAHRVMVNDRGDEEVNSFPVMRSWTVFNAAQVEGSDLEQFRAVQPCPEGRFVGYEPAERVIVATGADIRHGGGKAVYRTEEDFIQLPLKESFGEAHEYYGTALHELVHWSGSQARMSRLNKLARFGDKSYAMEELVAELGSAFLLAELAIPQSDDLSNVTAYLADWLKVLESDPCAIFTAASAASKAADFILAFSRPTPEEIPAEAVGIAD